MSEKRPPPGPIYILRGHKGNVTALHFTFEEDDALTEVPSLISGSDSGEIVIWSLKTNRIYHRFEGHNKKLISYLCYYKSSLLSQGRDGQINVWKFIGKEWNVVSSFNSSAYGFCSACLFLTESKPYLIVPTGDKSIITFYDYNTGAKLKSTENNNPKCKLKSGNEICICIKTFEKSRKLYLLIGYDGGFLTLWDYDTNEEKSTIKCHPEILSCMDYDAEHKNHGISGSVDNTLQVWKIDENDELHKVKEITITNPGINAVKIRDDGKIVITAGQDRTIRVFSWKTLKLLAVLQWHKQPVSILDFSTRPFGKYNALFASGSKDKNICIGSIY